jgi:hypothetical protein
MLISYLIWDFVGGFPQKFPENAGIDFKIYRNQLLSENYLPAVRDKIFIVFDPFVSRILNNFDIISGKRLQSGWRKSHLKLEAM